MTETVARYKKKRDLLVEGLREHYEFAIPGGAFYLFPRAPWGTATEFISEAIRNNLLVILELLQQTRYALPDSYAASDEMLYRGIEIMKKLARNRGS